MTDIRSSEGHQKIQFTAMAGTHGQVLVIFSEIKLLNNNNQLKTILFLWLEKYLLFDWYTNDTSRSEW